MYGQTSLKCAKMQRTNHSCSKRHSWVCSHLPFYPALFTNTACINRHRDEYSVLCCHCTSHQYAVFNCQHKPTYKCINTQLIKSNITTLHTIIIRDLIIKLLTFCTEHLLTKLIYVCYATGSSKLELSEITQNAYFGVKGTIGAPINM